MMKAYLERPVRLTARLVLAILLIAMLLAGALPATPVQAAGPGSTLIDTFSASQGIGDFGPWVLGANVSEAQSFKTTTAAYVLTGIDLNLYTEGSTPVAGTYSVDIYTVDTNHAPLALKANLWSGNNSDLPNCSGSNCGSTQKISSPLLNVVLDQNTDYQVVVKLTAAITGVINLGYYSIGICPPASCPNPSYTAENTGSGWSSGVEGFPFRMIVTANAETDWCSTNAAGNLSTPGTWSCGVPADTQALIINHPVTLTGDVTHNSGILLNADVTTGANVLTLGSAASLGGTGDIVGTVRRVTPGVGAMLQFNNQFTSIFFNTAPSPMDVTLFKTAPLTWTGGGRVVQRYYQLTPTGGVDATIRLAFKTSELNGATEANLVLWRYDGTNWNPQPVPRSPVDTANHAIQMNGVTTFSPWTFSDVNPTAVTLSSLSATSGTLNLAGASGLGLAALLALALGGWLLRSRRPATQHRAQ